MIDWINITNIDHNYYLKIPKISYSTKSVHEEAQNNIKYIIENYPPPYTLCVSGGVDSQSMLYFWKNSGVPFQAISFKYNYDLNQHDLRSLYLFSEKNNIKINYIDFDLLSFYDNEYVSYTEKYRCGSPHICVYMKFSDYVTDGTILYSGNFLDKNNDLFVLQNEFGLYRFAKQKNKNLVPYFLCETKNFAYSLKNLSRDKATNYQLNEIPVIASPLCYTGFEEVKNYYDQHYKHRVTTQDRLCKKPNQGSGRVYDLLLRNKYELKYMHDKYEVRFINVG
jgi:hypothetical protein